MLADTAVLSGGALVGRVTEVSRSTATVQLINDADSQVAVRVRDSRELALVSGASQGSELQLELFDPLVQIKPDQRLVTVGSPGGRPFPPGLAVGSVGTVVVVSTSWRSTTTLGCGPAGAPMLAPPATMAAAMPPAPSTAGTATCSQVRPGLLAASSRRWRPRGVEVSFAIAGYTFQAGP